MIRVHVFVEVQVFIMSKSNLDISNLSNKLEVFEVNHKCLNLSLSCLI
jgi:hypothetical protein